ncbi:MAG: PEGA domain-containing protein [Candidatus Sulfotelmatobacter sp.]
MSKKIGHFEVLSELSKSATGVVYKANDPATSQTVALKAIQLSVFGDRAPELQKCLLQEAEATKVLSNPNLTVVYGAGEIEGRFCAAMEYIQGNSVATMLERKEGFSIWDLLDIGRQVCGGFDHAHSHRIYHYSLEPAKIMCGWDGTVRVLSFGVSSVGKFTAQMPGVPSVLHYMSPEQIRGEEIDGRSNLFSLGALFYEMVTDHQAFEGADAESLRQSVLTSAPIPPIQSNPKLHPLLSDLILKALSKNPGERYQSGRELLDDLERCKESKSSAAAKTPAAAAKPPAVAARPNAVPPAKPLSVPPVAVPKAVLPPSVPKPAPTRNVAAAAAASTTTQMASLSPVRVAPASPTAAAATAAAPGRSTTAAQPASVSSPVIGEPLLETFADSQPVVQQKSATPNFVVDPMMAEDGPSRGNSSVSFSEMTELPPLKEIHITPPSPPSALPESAAFSDDFGAEPEKPKLQPREVAEKALKEIKNVPPSLMIYSVAGAAVLILIIAIALVLHINHLNTEEDSPRPTTELASPYSANPPAPVPAAPQPTQPNAADAQNASPQGQASQPPVLDSDSQPAATNLHSVKSARGKYAKKKSVAAPLAPAVLPGLMTIDSTPPGAQVQLDGKTDPSWVTPVTLSGIDAGQHTITVSKAGYVSDTHAVSVASGGKASVVSHLVQLLATLSVASTPPGANVYIDGKDTGKVTPAQVSVDKGQHIVLVRKAGFIDETLSAQFVLAQTVTFSPALRELGNVDGIRTVGKFKKLFGGKEAQAMATIVVRTQPKGAQVAINQHMLDKPSPVDFMIDPGNYVIDITLTGYAPIHKVITVDKGGKAVVDEVMQHD